MTAVVVTESGYRAPAVCRAAGVTYRQLSHWTHLGRVTASIHRASGTGSQHVYALDDVVKVATIARLGDAGVSLAQAVGLASSCDGQATATVDLAPGVRLVVDLAAIRADVIRNLARRHRRTR